MWDIVRKLFGVQIEHAPKPSLKPSQQSEYCNMKVDRAMVLQRPSVMTVKVLTVTTPALIDVCHPNCYHTCSPPLSNLNRCCMGFTNLDTFSYFSM